PHRPGTRRPRRRHRSDQARALRLRDAPASIPVPAERRRRAARRSEGPHRVHRSLRGLGSDRRSAVSANGRHHLRRNNFDQWAGRMLMTQKDPFEPDIVARALAKNRLGVPSVVFFGVAGAAPLTVIIGAISATYAIIGSTAVPIAYVAVAGILSLFTVGFVAMSRHIVNSGAFYSYISHGLGRVIGVGAAFVALPAYAMMQIGLFGLFGVVASGLLNAAGIPVGWFACALIAWAL